MMNSKNWWAGFVCGAVSVVLLVLCGGVVYSILTTNGMINRTAMTNLAMGAWTGGVMAKVFTVMNVATVVTPIAIWKINQSMYGRAYDFCRRLPTMIGMLGTLWSLLASNLDSPGTLAGNFSIAIVSTFIGIILQIFIEFVGRMRPFCECDDGDAPNEKV